MQSRQDVLDNLIVTCAKEIEHKGVTISNSNKAISPMVFIYAGEYAVDNFELTRNVIDANWRANSRYIYHIGILRDDTNNIIVRNLVDDSDIYNTNLNDDVYFLDEVFSSMLAAPVGTFNKTNIARLNFVVSVNDTYFKEYLDLIINLKTSLNGITLFKDLYLLITQGGGLQDRTATENAIRMLYGAEKDDTLSCFKQIYVLSNRMKNGTILDQYNKKTNFRLIADILLLIDNDDEQYQNRIEIFNFGVCNFRTASYRIVEKPCREIVVVMLKTLLNKVLDIPKKNKEEIMQMFEREQIEEIYFAEKFEKEFPNESDFMYLPYTSEGLKNLLDNFKTNKKYGKYRIDEGAVDKGTYGCYSDFFDLNYRQFIKAKFDHDDFINRLVENCLNKYNHSDFIEYFKYDDIVEQACKQQDINVERHFATTFYNVLSRYSFLKARNEYFDLIKPYFQQAMKHLYNSAVNFEKLLIDMQNDISSVCTIENDGIYDSIEAYYSEYINEFFNQHKDFILSQINISIKDYKELADILIKLFMKILSLDTSNVLSCGFTEELSNRLGNAATPAKRDMLIKGALVPGIDDFTRVNVADDNLIEMFDAYLCDKKSDFLDLDKVPLFFDTNDENCFERVKIFKFNSLRDILGSRMEEF